MKTTVRLLPVAYCQAGLRQKSRATARAVCGPRCRGKNAWCWFADMVAIGQCLRGFGTISAENGAFFTTRARPARFGAQEASALKRASASPFEASSRARRILRQSRSQPQQAEATHSNHHLHASSNGTASVQEPHGPCQAVGAQEHICLHWLGSLVRAHGNPNRHHGRSRHFHPHQVEAIAGADPFRVGKRNEAVGFRARFIDNHRGRGLQRGQPGRGRRRGRLRALTRNRPAASAVAAAQVSGAAMAPTLGAARSPCCRPGESAEQPRFQPRRRLAAAIIVRQLAKAPG